MNLDDRVKMTNYKVVPAPPDEIESTYVDIWYEIGQELLNRDLLTDSALSGMEDLCFWERQKRQVMRRVDEASSGPDSMSGGEEKRPSASDHLANLRAVQRQIDRTRRELGLPSVEKKELTRTPLIPDVVFDQLPTMLAELTGLHDDKRHRDLFLTLCLPIVAAHLSRTVTGYADRVVSPDMNTCVVDGSGRAERLIRQVTKLGREMSLYLKVEQPGLVRDWILTDATPPSRLMEHFAARGGRAVVQSRQLIPWLSEPVDDSFPLPDGFMANCFWHEPISWARDRRHPVHQSTHLSLLLTTTPGAFRTLSRESWRAHCSYVSFYLFDDEDRWQSARPDSKTDELNQKIESASRKLLQLYKILEARRTPLKIELMDHQWDMIDETFAEKIEILNQLGLPEDLHLSNKRMAVQAVRLVSAFTVLRCYESHPEQIEQAESVQPGHSDMVAALWLTDTFIKHAIRLYEQLPDQKSERARRWGERYQQFLAVLPLRFKTSEAVSLAQRLDIPVRTAKRYLRVMIDENQLERIRHGVYQKLCEG